MKKLMILSNQIIRYIMKNKLIIILLFSSLIFANNMSKLPKDFLKTFEAYKTFLKNKDAKNLYNLELPYFRYLNNFDSYKAYINSHVSIEDIKITNVVRKNEKNIEIIVGIKAKNEKNMFFLSLQWYNINNNYFMLTKDDIIFRY